MGTHTQTETPKGCVLLGHWSPWVGIGWAEGGGVVLFCLESGQALLPLPSLRERLSSVGGHHSKPLRRSDIKGSVVIEKVSQGRQSQGYSEQGKDDLAESWETLA